MGCMNDSPCRYCVPPKRTEWCHSVCKDYADWKVKIGANTKKKRVGKLADAFLAEGAAERKRQYMRGLHMEKGAIHK